MLAPQLSPRHYETIKVYLPLIEAYFQQPREEPNIWRWAQQEDRLHTLCHEAEQKVQAATSVVFSEGAHTRWCREAFKRNLARDKK